MQKFLTVNEVAERYGICKASVVNHVRDGKFPRGILIGHSRRWALSELEAFEAEAILKNNQKQGL